MTDRDGADALSAGGVNAGMALIAPQLWASLKLDKEAVALAEEKAHGSKIDLVAEVKKAYMAVLLAQESLRVLEANYAMRRPIIRISRISTSRGSRRVRQDPYGDADEERPAECRGSTYRRASC